MARRGKAAEKLLTPPQDPRGARPVALRKMGSGGAHLGLFGRPANVLPIIWSSGRESAVVS